MANRQYCLVKKKQLKQFMSGALTQDQIEEFMRRRLENKIKNGQYNQIANIPRVISKLTAETELL